MRRSVDFARTLRSGRRARRGCLIVHQCVAGDDVARDTVTPLVGLIVNKAVGGSVVRHRVSRRLRAQLAGRLSQLPAGSRTVVRALPHAADASSADLGANLDRAFAGLGASR